MKREILLGDRWVGEGHPAYIIAEIGINHNGDMGVAKQLIDASVVAGCDAVMVNPDLSNNISWMSITNPPIS